MDRFPVFLWPPSKHAWRLRGASLAGGQPISGPPQSAEMSAGGVWEAPYTAALLRTLSQFASWRAWMASPGFVSGVMQFEVPVIDALQPWPGGVRPGPEPHSDFQPFADDAMYVADPIVAQLAANAYMPAWPAPPVSPHQAQIQITAGSALRGGEFFSLRGASGKIRLHMIGRILGVAGDVSTVTFVPPLREDYDAGTAVEFNEPACTMKADISTIADAWPEMSPPFQAKDVAITFIESIDAPS